MKSKTLIFWLTLFGVMAAIIFQGGNGLESAHAATIYFASGWEDGQELGNADKVLYSKEVAGYFNVTNPSPECSRRPGETVRTGNYSLMIAGYSRADYAYCYYRVFDLNLDVVPGMKIGYWIYHKQGTPKIGVDGHFTDGNTLRDFGSGALQDQYGVRIHPALRQDPMNEWYYVEVDLSPAAGKTLDTIMFAFDNGGDKFKGPYRAYVDDFKIFKENPCQASVSESNWKGEYFNNLALSGAPAMVRDDGDGFLNFDWGLGSPDSSCGLGEDRFSIRWTRKVDFSPGFYQFIATSDDGVRLWIDDQLKLEKWVDQPPTDYRVGPVYLSGNHILRMEYYENAVGAVARLSWVKVDQPPTHCQANVPADHWKGEYFSNMALTGTPVMVRDDGQDFLNFDWGLGSPESSCGIGIDHFSVRWTRTVDFSPGQYQFTATVDDGVQLYIDDQLQLEKWIDQPPTPYTVGPIYLEGSHTLRMEYYENSGGAVGKLSWLQVGPPPFTGTLLFQNGWEDGEIQGFKDQVEYSQNVTDARSNPRSRETAHDGNGSFMISGVSQGGKAYSYHRVFDVEIRVKKGLKIGYWIYHAQGTPKVALDGHFSDGTVFRDVNNNGFLADQYGVRIHPASRNDPLSQWYYVGVDLSKAEGKTIDYLMLAFDNGGDGFTGTYRTYADDLKIFYGEMQSLTQGQPKGSFGSGRQTDLVTQTEQWRWAPDFYGHSGLDDIASRLDACGVQRNYAMGFHQNDLVEYLMKFGGEFNRLWLRGMGSQPGPVKMEIYIDGHYRAIAAWDANSNCSQDVALNIQGIPYGTHAIAVKFVNDYGDPAKGIDRNMLLEGLFVTRSGEVRSKWAYPVGTAETADGWVVTNALGETYTDWYSGHLGEDWAKYGDSFGEPVYAPAAGRVITVLPRCGNYLNVLVIEHNVEGFVEPLYSFYGHVDAGNVREGDWVERRQQIATVGNPRPDFEPHLHFELKNRTALLQGPFSPCTDVSKGWYISAGYSRLVNDYDSRNDYSTPSNGNIGSRFYHPRRFIEGNSN